MNSVSAALERRAAGVPYERLARAFLEFDRWTGDDPRLLLADAAAASTGGDSASARPAVEAFRTTFLESDRVATFADLAAVGIDDPDLAAAFGAERNRRVLVEGARTMAERPEDDDLAALRGWAATTDPYRYDEDRIGAISGVGPATFQYLRMLAGVDAVRPDEPTRALVTALAEETGAPIGTRTALHTLAACEWLAIVTDHRRIEIDRIAWWIGADEDDRDAVENAL